MLCKHIYVTGSEHDWENTWVALSILCQFLKRTPAKRTADEMNPGATNRERNEPSPSADFQGDHNRSAQSRNVCSCMAFPTCLLIAQRLYVANPAYLGDHNRSDQSRRV